MHPPELRRAQSPPRATHGADTPTLVDKAVGNVGIQEFEQLVTAGHRKVFHARTAYPVELVASGLSSKPRFCDRTNCHPARYATSCNTLYKDGMFEGVTSDTSAVKVCGWVGIDD